ncbi:hypothetical protein [Photobacterium galatheae]|uniref:Uncharacterized protein n=1 Tax=Photobacterium galatheae TaxID=1654360 RepID=A0A066S0V7_9GAMM|nr:hypothetical protein [Photobacterium galatheae]KDM93258.1 hypothetical protein EA58_01200 [Photobacterium galatheae]MCM0150380.1 hypothetical protein [Photobacterium galatheae]
MNTTISLPEYTEAYQAQQRQQVLDAEVVHEWECKLRTHFKSYSSFIVAGMVSTFWGGAYFLTPDINILYLWVISMVIMIPVNYFLFDADYDYKGQITPKGIIIQKTERVPEIFYKATRGMAYFGIGVCLIAGLMMGPLAFVGAGAFALLSFKMTGFHKQPQQLVYPFFESAKYRQTYSDAETIYQDDIYSLMCDIPEIEDASLYNMYWFGFQCHSPDFPEIENILKRYVQFSD